MGRKRSGVGEPISQLERKCYNTSSNSNCHQSSLSLTRVLHPNLDGVMMNAGTETPKWRRATRQSSLEKVKQKPPKARPRCLATGNFARAFLDTFEYLSLSCTAMRKGRRRLSVSHRGTRRRSCGRRSVRHRARSRKTIFVESFLLRKRAPDVYRGLVGEDSEIARHLRFPQREREREDEIGREETVRNSSRAVS